MDIVGYLADSATPYDDVTMPANTGQQFIENVVYVDKHPQPSHDGTTGTLPVGLEDFWGNITMANSRMILQVRRGGKGARNERVDCLYSALSPCYCGVAVLLCHPFGASLPLYSLPLYSPLLSFFLSCHSPTKRVINTLPCMTSVPSRCW